MTSQRVSCVIYFLSNANNQRQSEGLALLFYEIFWILEHFPSSKQMQMTATHSPDFQEILGYNYLLQDVGEFHPAELSQSPWMRINHPGCSLLFQWESGWRFSLGISEPLSQTTFNEFSLGMHIKERRCSLKITFLGSQGSF